MLAERSDVVADAYQEYASATARMHGTQQHASDQYGEVYMDWRPATNLYWLDRTTKIARHYISATISRRDT